MSFIVKEEEEERADIWCDIVEEHREGAAMEDKLPLNGAIAVLAKLTITELNGGVRSEYCL